VALVATLRQVKVVVDSVECTKGISNGD
jgi:hypothetical protein